MHVISYQCLREYGKSHADCCETIDNWYKIASNANWSNLLEIQYLSVKLKKLNYVGWVKERNPTFTGICWVSLCSTQPTKILNRTVLT